MPQLGILKFFKSPQSVQPTKPNGQVEATPPQTELKSQASSPAVERPWRLIDAINVWLGAKKLPELKDEDSLLDVINRGLQGRQESPPEATE